MDCMSVYIDVLMDVRMAHLKTCRRINVDGERKIVGPHEKNKTVLNLVSDATLTFEHGFVSNWLAE